jgi:hypothetical protein
VFTSLFGVQLQRASRGFLLGVVLTASGLVGCSAPFQSITPSGFVELETRDTDYKHRVTNADGLVLATRVLKHEPRGELSFWERAVENQLRNRGGYALLGKADVKSADGTPGKELRFGHDEGSQPHLYTVWIFATEERLYRHEAGGTRELMKQHAAAAADYVARFRIR